MLEMKMYLSSFSCGVLNASSAWKNVGMTARRKENPMMHFSWEPVKFLGWKVHTFMLANGIYNGPVINLLSVLCIFDKNPFTWSCGGGKKALIVLVLLFVVFGEWQRGKHSSERVTAVCAGHDDWAGLCAGAEAACVFSDEHFLKHQLTTPAMRAAAAVPPFVTSFRHVVVRAVQCAAKCIVWSTGAFSSFVHNPVYV